MVPNLHFIFEDWHNIDQEDLKGERGEHPTTFVRLVDASTL